ncbi:lamin tail domain-containing protein [Chryseobacterium chendengshani]|uniref:lamin tail domain-containing protein n=1 Tax=unclassified Chryseobacterium TaxID=2593645 RepID=UPI001C63E077|nr:MULTISPECIES: lamin tail domain-containing protein [unclassified Chryseobacterium]MBW7675943.1 lamin tail domain-containing protein [Chryseobacterium sp. LJ756]MBW8524451.1 lamin tail domain-containing protein [Chryseobacterium sp. LJ668]QYK15305.1 lamin tail domain-containing protein [Chryseobacterium sp. LJ668]
MKKVFTFIGLVSIAAFSDAQIVINEIYTGGGILGATLTNDFIELKNIGNTTASLNGATIQYGSATGPFTQYHTLPSITLPPGQTYLIQEGSDGGGIINLLNPNLIVNVVLNLDGSGPVAGVGLAIGLTSGKVALASNTTPVTGPTASNVLDFVGYGSANQYEGSSAAPSPTILNSISRITGDTNNNGIDFTASLASPQSGTLAVNDVYNTSVRSNFIKNTLVKNNEIVFGSDVKDLKVYTLSGQLVKTTSVKANETLNVAELQKGNYIVTGTVNNQPVSQKILKD